MLMVNRMQMSTQLLDAPAVWPACLQVAVQALAKDLGISPHSILAMLARYLLFAVPNTCAGT
jgi:hypothetical protein